MTPVPLADQRRGDGDQVIEALEALCIVTKDGFAGQSGSPLVLRGWQKTLLRHLFARRPDGRRRHRLALIGMPRKNGKSALCSGLALDGLLFDGLGAEVYSAAAEKEQARIVFGETKKMIEANPELAELCKPMRDVIEVPTTGSIYRVLSAEAYSKEGLNISRALIDELHAHPTDELFNVLTLASAARVDPMVISITTAGVMSGRDGRDSICYRLFKHGRDVAEGRVDDPSLFMAWWGAPDGADHKDPKVWEAANPGYGDLIDPEDFASSNLRTPENEWRAKRLNQWLENDTAWLPAGAWEALADTEANIPEHERVVLGFDGSYAGDSTALVAVSVTETPHVELVGLWEPSVTGQRVETAQVVETIRDACRRWQVLELAADPALWRDQLEDLAAERIAVKEFPQSPSRMIPATQRLYEAILGGWLTHSGDPALARHLRNARTKMSREGGVQLTKGFSHGSPRKIDAAVALVMAYDRAAEYAQDGGGVHVGRFSDFQARFTPKQIAAKRQAHEDRVKEIMARAQSRQRGTTAERGYGADHQRERDKWVPKVARGEVDCARCHHPIAPDEEWHLDHTDDRSGYLGPSHAHCNDSAAGRKGRR